MGISYHNNHALCHKIYNILGLTQSLVTLNQVKYNPGQTYFVNTFSKPVVFVIKLLTNVCYIAYCPMTFSHVLISTQ